MQRQAVKSSNIVSIGWTALPGLYEGALEQCPGVLEIEFKADVIWQYKPVWFGTWLELIEADSVGGYFAKHIRNNPVIESAPGYEFLPATPPVE